MTGTKTWYDGSEHDFRVASHYTEILRDGPSRVQGWRTERAVKCIYTCDCHRGMSFHRTLPQMRKAEKYTLNETNETD